MAFVALSQYMTNSVPGNLQGINDSSIYDVDKTAKFALGSGFKRADGNVYRYASFATSGPAQGKLVSQTVANTCSASTNALITAPVAGMQMGNDPIGVYAGALGSRYVWFTLASIVKDAFAGGYFTCNKDTGYGYQYRIKANTASATQNGNANIVIVELYEPLQVAVDTTTDISVTGCLFNDLVAALCTTNHIIVGTTCADMSAASTSVPLFGWVCTHGVAVCLQDGTVANGDLIQPSTSVAGAFITAGVGTTAVTGLAGQSIIGYAIDQAGTGNYSSVYLQIE